MRAKAAVARVLKSYPPLFRTASRPYHAFNRGFATFDTLSPGLPDALAQAFRLAREEGGNSPGDYFEFGLYRGYSFAKAFELCRELGLDDTRPEARRRRHARLRPVDLHADRARRARRSADGGKHPALRRLVQPRRRRAPGAAARVSRVPRSGPAAPRRAARGVSAPRKDLRLARRMKPLRGTRRACQHHTGSVATERVLRIRLPKDD